jgi:hypothetical protein
MAFTYDLTTAIGKVRLLIPDNVLAAYDLEDDEIEYFLAQVGQDVNAAAIRACKWLARKYAKMASFTADGLRVDHTQRAAEYAARAKEIEGELGSGVSSPEISRSDGFSENAATSEYERQSRIIYMDL